MKFTLGCHLVLGAALVVGCGKDKDDDDSSSTEDPNGINSGGQPGGSGGGGPNTTPDSPLSAFTTQQDCNANNGFWYDSDDVKQTTAAGFAALQPSCRETSVDFCPDNVDMVLGKRANGTTFSVHVGDGYISTYGQNLTQIFSTVRCLDSSYGGLSLSLDNNSLTSLDLTNNPGIYSISVSDNPNLTSIALPRDTSGLVSLYIDETKVPISIVNGLGQLERLSFSGNSGMTSQAVASLTALTDLTCVGCGLSAFDVSPLTKLESLDLSSNSLESLDISHSPGLRWLHVGSNTLQTLDLSHATDLTSLNVSDNLLSSLDVSDCVKLEWLSAGTNLYTAIDLSANTKLTQVNVSNTLISTINVTSSPLIESLNLSDNGNMHYDGMATKLDLHNQSKLRNLDLAGSDITLNFVSGVTMHPTFLASTDIWITIDEANWLASAGADKPANWVWDYGYVTAQ